MELDNAAKAPAVEISEVDGVRLLRLGGSAVQSAMRLAAPFHLELEYTRAMMGFLLFCRPRDVALIGLGGGSLAKFMHRHLPETRIAAVELYPEVVAAARESFLLPPDDDRLQVSTGDGAAFAAAMRPASQDAVLVDGYGPEGIVEAFTESAFYRDCHALLRPGGVAVFNLWDSDARHGEHLGRLADAFDGPLLRLPAETKGNGVVFAFKPPFPDTSFAHLAGRAARLEADLGLEFDAFLVRMGYCNPCSDSAFVV